jgi:hypothetical protein
MNVDQEIRHRFLVFLRGLFPEDQFRLLVHQSPYLRAVATYIRHDLDGEERTTSYVAMNRLLDRLDAVVVERQDDETMMVLEGEFEGRKCRLTLLLPFAVSARS